MSAFRNEVVRQLAVESKKANQLSFNPYRSEEWLYQETLIDSFAKLDEIFGGQTSDQIRMRLDAVAQKTGRMPPHNMTTTLLGKACAWMLANREMLEARWAEKAEKQKKLEEQQKLEWERDRPYREALGRMREEEARRRKEYEATMRREAAEQRALEKKMALERLARISLADPETADPALVQQAHLLFEKLADDEPNTAGQWTDRLPMDIKPGMFFRAVYECVFYIVVLRDVARREAEGEFGCLSSCPQTIQEILNVSTPAQRIIYVQKTLQLRDWLVNSVGIVDLDMLRYRVPEYMSTEDIMKKWTENYTSGPLSLEDEDIWLALQAMQFLSKTMDRVQRSSNLHLVIVPGPELTAGYVMGCFSAPGINPRAKRLVPTTVKFIYRDSNYKSKYNK